MDRKNGREDAAENEVIKTAFWVVAGLRDTFRYLRPVFLFYIAVMSTILLFCGSERCNSLSETRF